MTSNQELCSAETSAPTPFRVWKRVVAQSLVLAALPHLILVGVSLMFTLNNLKTPAGQIPLSDAPWVHTLASVSAWLFLLLAIPWDSKATLRLADGSRAIWLRCTLMRAGVVGASALVYAASFPAMFAW